MRTVQDWHPNDEQEERSRFLVYSVDPLWSTQYSARILLTRLDPGNPSMRHTSQCS
ncbi:Villin-like protein, partial [Clarias magur]